MTKLDERSFNINGTLILLVICAFSVLLTACSHTGVTQSNGWGLKTSWDPNSMMPTIFLGEYSVVAVAMRENTEFEYSTTNNTTASMNADSTASPTISKPGSTTIKIKTGQQSNGYTVDEKNAEVELARINSTKIDDKTITTITTPADSNTVINAQVAN